MGTRISSLHSLNSPNPIHKKTWPYKKKYISSNKSSKKWLWPELAGLDHIGKYWSLTPRQNGIVHESFSVVVRDPSDPSDWRLHYILTTGEIPISSLTSSLFHPSSEWGFRNSSRKTRRSTTELLATVSFLSRKKKSCLSDKILKKSMCRTACLRGKCFHLHDCSLSTTSLRHVGAESWATLLPNLLVLGCVTC